MVFDSEIIRCFHEIVMLRNFLKELLTKIKFLVFYFLVPQNQTFIIDSIQDLMPECNHIYKCLVVNYEYLNPKTGTRDL